MNVTELSEKDYEYIKMNLKRFVDEWWSVKIVKK
jgi:5-bromo-4-chloroindolyl phosphate hydrolysis protein